MMTRKRQISSILVVSIITLRLSVSPKSLWNFRCSLKCFSVVTSDFGMAKVVFAIDFQQQITECATQAAVWHHGAFAERLNFRGKCVQTATSFRPRAQVLEHVKSVSSGDPRWSDRAQKRSDAKSGSWVPKQIDDIIRPEIGREIALKFRASTSRLRNPD